MPLELFPIWIQEQYDLKMLAYKGFVHLEMRRAVWGLPQAGIFANKRLRHKLAPFGYYEYVSNPRFMVPQNETYFVHVICQQFWC
jgi:hypothetical protein